MFADLNWDSAQIQNGIARYIVEKGYGYETDALFGGTVPLFQGLLVGDIDVTMEIWLPNQNNVWGPAVAAGRVVDVGSSLSDNWQSAFVVPTYVVEENPGLTTVQSLMEHFGVFEPGEWQGDSLVVYRQLVLLRSQRGPGGVLRP